MLYHSGVLKVSFIVNRRLKNSYLCNGNLHLQSILTLAISAASACRISAVDRLDICLCLGQALDSLHINPIPLYTPLYSRSQNATSQFRLLLNQLMMRNVQQNPGSVKIKITVVL